MATGTDFLMRKITIEADELANKWNKTRDPSIRDQWFKLLQTVPLPEHLQPRKERT